MSNHNIIKIGMGYNRAKRIIELIDRLQKYAVLPEDKNDLVQLRKRILEGMIDFDRYN